MKFSKKDFFIKCDQLRRKLQIWLHLLKKSLMENFIFCAVIFSMKYWVIYVYVLLRFPIYHSLVLAMLKWKLASK